MSTDFAKVKELLKSVVPDFGLNEAKMVAALLNGTILTAKDLSEEMGITVNRVYGIANPLVEKEILNVTSTLPAQYSISDLDKACKRYANLRIKELEKIPDDMKQLTLVESSEMEHLQYLLQIRGDKVKVFNQTSKRIVNEKGEIKQLRKIFEALDEQATKMATY